MIIKSFFILHNYRITFYTPNVLVFDMSDKSTISDDYKEIDSSSVTSSKVDQASEVNQQTNHLNDRTPDAFASTCHPVLSLLGRSCFPDK